MTISVYVDVDAESPEEAKLKAEDCGVMSLCHQCTVGEEGSWSTSGELDGQPEINEDDDVIEIEKRRRL